MNSAHSPLDARPQVAWAPYPQQSPAPLGPAIPAVTSEPLRHPVGAGVVVAVAWAIVVPATPFRSVGIAVALALIVCAAVFVAGRDRRSLLLGLAAVALLPWLAIRHSPWLHAVNLTVALLLFLTGAATQPGTPLAAPMHRYLQRWWTAITATVFGPRVVAETARTQLQGFELPTERVRHLGRAALIAIGVSLVVTALLASGDALFASYIDLDWAWPWGLWAIVSALSGLAALAIAIGAFRSRQEKVIELGTLDMSSIVLTLCGLSLTILSYGVVQLVAALSGPTYVQQRTGLTYADYARSGFFQLVAVVAISVAVLAAARSSLARSQRRSSATRWWAAALTCGVISLVVASVIKLAIYADRLGLTMLRVYTITFAVWLGLVALATFAALLRPNATWLTPALLISVVIGTLGMNVANPERLVAEHNVGRARTGAEFDLAYLATLSLDARPTILAAVSEFGLDPHIDHRSGWRSKNLCEPIDHSHGWFGGNAAVSAAARAQATHCPT